MTTTVDRKAEGIAKAWVCVREMLRLEAEADLKRDAEIGASEDHEDASFDSKRWYGLDVLRKEREQLVARKIAAELAHKQAEEQLLVAEIRGHGMDEALERFATADGLLADLEQQLWNLEDDALDTIREQQAQLVDERAQQLEQRYLVLSKDLPMNVNHPAVPEFLRRWVVRQQQRGALAVDAYRMLVYLVLRDTVFTGVMNAVPVIEDDELPSQNPLEAAGLPKSKTEQRWNLMLARQFRHENGDLRTDRGTPGEQDFDAEPEYAGMPVLRALVNPDVRLCHDCGAPVKDNVVVKATKDGVDGWQGVTQCDCTTDEHTPVLTDYDAVVELLLKRTGQGVKITQYRQLSRQRRAVRRQQQVA